MGLEGREWKMRGEGLSPGSLGDRSQWWHCSDQRGISFNKLWRSAGRTTRWHDI